MNGHVLITGAGSGLGRALARSYAERGARVLVTDRDLERARTTVAELPGAGHEAAQLDVGSEAAMQTLREQLATRGMTVDILINNAGVASGGALSAIGAEEWRRVMNVNLDGVQRGIAAFVPDMIARRRGQVINIASLAGFAGAPLLGAYGVAKAGVIALSEILRAELAPYGIRVAVACPSFFPTALLESASSAVPPEVTAFAARAMRRGPLDAHAVAEYIVAAAESGRFLILPHREARVAHRLKRWFPEWYFRLLLRRFARMRPSAGRESAPE